MPKSRTPLRAKKAKATGKPKTGKPAKSARRPAASRLWLGAGLCPEAQGDGLPCRGVEGECERCGRALPQLSQ